MIVNLGFVLIEAGCGLAVHSTALLADAGHNLSDVLGLALAGGAAWLAGAAGGAHRTYGFGKATILAALANALLLVFACGAIVTEAVTRLFDPQPTLPAAIMIVAAIGVVVNAGTALLFVAGRKHDVNVRAAFQHMVADAAVSVGVIVAGALIAFTGRTWIDPATSLAIVAMIALGTWGLLKESLNLAMDVAPTHVDVVAVRRLLLDQPGVAEVHDLHVWNMSTTETALTAHLVRAEGIGGDFLCNTEDALRHAFGLQHVTLQVETAPCARRHDLHP
jgi:cobalt-zinc-cadmium efflux system protein